MAICVGNADLRSLQLKCVSPINETPPMYNQPPKSPLSGGLWQLRALVDVLLFLEFTIIRHCERAPVDRDAQSYGTRSVPTTINVYLFLEFTIIPFHVTNSRKRALSGHKDVTNFVEILRRRRTNCDTESMPILSSTVMRISRTALSIWSSEIALSM